MAFNTRAKRNEETKAIRESCHQIQQLRSELRDSFVRIRELSPETVKQTREFEDACPESDFVTGVGYRNKEADTSSNAHTFSGVDRYSSILRESFDEQCDLRLSANPDIQQDLSSSRPYKRAARNSSRLSIDSVNTTSMEVPSSWISDFSVTDVSNLSVVRLPIAISELSTSGCYVAARNDTGKTIKLSQSKPTQRLRARASLFTRRTRQSILSVALARTFYQPSKHKDSFGGLACERTKIVVSLKHRLDPSLAMPASLEGSIPACIAFACAALRPGESGSKPCNVPIEK